MPTNPPTTTQLAASIAVIEERTAELLRALEVIQDAASTENDKMWTALRGVAGLDGLSTGLAAFDESVQSGVTEIRQAIRKNARKIHGGIRGGVADIQAVLAPLQALAPQATASPLEPGVDVALREMRNALGGRRDTNFPGMTTEFDGPVKFIGQT